MAEGETVGFLAAFIVCLLGFLISTSLLLRVAYTQPNAVKRSLVCCPRCSRSVQPAFNRSPTAISIGTRRGGGGPMVATAGGTSSTSEAEGGAVAAAAAAGGRRHKPSVVKPELDVATRYSWEIDPDKLKFKHIIGRGNFGEVWLASWLGSPVAVKNINAELQAKEKLVKRFIDEIMLMSILHHPNVVLFLGAWPRRPRLLLVLEYCSHGSLHHFLKLEAKHGITITMPLVYRFALDIARGVLYLHRRVSVVQRDLKARNILVDGSLNAKVADFGLSRILNDEVSNKLTACGTPAWTAPEIVKMERYTEKVDVYSFGIILWELITKQEPYGGQKGVQIAYAAAEQGLRPEIPSFCPPDYAQLMQECWSPNPHDRPSFDEILRRLFQMKKNADAETAAEAASAGGGGAPAGALPPTAEADDSDADGGGSDAGRMIAILNATRGAMARRRSAVNKSATAVAIAVSPPTASGRSAASGRSGVSSSPVSPSGVRTPLAQENSDHAPGDAVTDGSGGESGGARAAFTGVGAAPPHERSPEPSTASATAIATSSAVGIPRGAGAVLSNVVPSEPVHMVVEVGTSSPLPTPLPSPSQPPPSISSPCVSGSDADAAREDVTMRVNAMSRASAVGGSFVMLHGGAPTTTVLSDAGYDSLANLPP